MKLFDISKEAEEQGLQNVEINSVTDDTSCFNEGDVFVCITGENFDGHSVAADMIKKGAGAVVVDHDLGLKQQIIVQNTRAYFSKLASSYYGNPTKKLKLIAATGTNGKSTVIAEIKNILEKNGHKTGSIGTVGYDVIGKVYEAHLTTPRQMELYRCFSEMLSNGAEYCVVEASSQALVQDRFADEIFECAIFTNLTQDHLDYHKTMERYYQAKRLLFDKTKRAVICIDDKYGEKLVKYLKHEVKIPYVTYSINDLADYYAVNIKTDSSGIQYWLSAMREEKSFPVEMAMPGIFNVANSIAAIAAASEIGVFLNDAVDAMQSYSGVRGRSEVIYSKDFTVICDYAHTDDALTKFLTSVRSFAKGRIICVFGAAGERDVVKRPIMGEAAAKNADFLIITSDNPRFENEEKIIEDVLIGVKRHDTEFLCFTDRRQAIKAALAEAKPADVVVLCGKGHETYQVIGDNYMPFDERKIVKEILEV